MTDGPTHGRTMLVLKSLLRLKNKLQFFHSFSKCCAKDAVHVHSFKSHGKVIKQANTMPMRVLFKTY